ncbi:hypothetical protein [Pseudoxanthomonas beigongshangi]
MNGMTMALSIAYLGLLASNTYAASKIEDAATRKRAKSAMSLVVIGFSIFLIVRGLR